MKTPTNLTSHVRSLLGSIALATAAFSATSHAQLISFETIPGDTPVEGLSISNQFLSTHGVTFSLEGGGSPVLAQVGAPLTAFTGYLGGGDTLTPGPAQSNIGQFFLTDDGLPGAPGVQPPNLIISYIAPVSNTSGVILDIDASESWNIEARDISGNVLQTVTLNSSNPAAGNGRATPFAFDRPTKDIYSLRMVYTGSTALGVGLAFDRLSPSSGAGPTASTEIATGITLTGATLNGLVNPNNIATTVHFEWGLTDSYGTSTPVQNIPAGETDVSFNASLTGLLPHTTYHYKVSATNLLGTNSGGDLTFTTANTTPIGTDDEITLPAGVGPFDIEIADLVINDTDGDGDDLTISAVTDGEHGTVTLDSEAGVVSYTLTDLAFSGEETFTYTVDDGFGGTDEVTVTLTIPTRDPVISILNIGSGPMNTGDIVPGQPTKRFKKFSVAGVEQKADGTPILFYKANTAGLTESSLAAKPAIFGRDTATDTFAQIVRAGDPAPGVTGGLFSAFKDPVGNAGVAFLATLKTGPTAGGVTTVNDTGIWTNITDDQTLGLVAREGSTVPGTSLVYKSFQSVVINTEAPGSPRVLFSAMLQQGVSGVLATDDAVLMMWNPASDSPQNPSIILREGQSITVVDGETPVIKTLKSFTSFNSPAKTFSDGRTDGSPDLAVVATFTDGSKAVVKLILTEYSANPTTVGYKYGPVSGLPGAQWSSFGNPAASQDDIYLMGTLKTGLAGVTTANANGLFRIYQGETSYETEVILRAGAAAPGLAGLTLKSFTDISVNSAGTDPQIAFRAKLAGTGVTLANGEALFATDLNPAGSGGIALIARIGTAAPDLTGPILKSIDSVTLPRTDADYRAGTAGAAQPGVVFRGKLLQGTAGVLSTNDECLWATTRTGGVRLIAREGDTVATDDEVIKTIKTLNVLKAVGGSQSHARAAGAGATIVYQALFTDGTTGIIKVVMP